MYFKNHTKLLFFLLLAIGSVACQNNAPPPTPSKITLEDIHDSTNRTLDSTNDKKKFSNKKERTTVLFFDENKYEINQERFNQKMAEGSYIPMERTSPTGIKQVYLLTRAAYAKQLENKPLPALAIRDLNGQLFTNEKLKGKVTILSFWFTSSSVNVQGMETLNPIAQKYYDNKEVIWLAASLDKADALSHFLKKRHWGFTFAADQEYLANKLHVWAYPTHLVIDKKGRIAKAIVRQVDNPSVFEDYIEQLLEE